jgi:alkylhydroperoxidase/carboxymuconolactone decarboxylase family protein YurZ
MMRQAGFENEELVAETGFNSSPKTKGVLIRAVKPLLMEVGMEKEKPGDSMSKYQEFFDSVYTDGVIDRKTKYLIALGTSLAAGCDP